MKRLYAGSRYLTTMPWSSSTYVDTTLYSLEGTSLIVSVSGRTAAEGVC
ncbi:MAG: hypothetical protein QXO71_08445 [Candidatus Jordarchaeaceae archaeon]